MKRTLLKILVVIVAVCSMFCVFTACDNSNNLSYDIDEQQIQNLPDDNNEVVYYNVFFNSNGGTTIASQKVKADSRITKPTDPIKDGFSFVGWYSNQGLTIEWDFNSYIVTTNITLYAKFIKNHEHNYIASVTAPTCMERGYTTYTCECGESYKGDYVDKLEHDYNSIVIKPTCTEKGYTTHTCSLCQYTYKGNYTDAIGHDYQTIGEPNVSCPLSSYQNYECSICHTEKRELVTLKGISSNHKNLGYDETCELCGWKVYANQNDSILMVNEKGELSAEFYGNTTYAFSDTLKKYIVNTYISNNVTTISSFTLSNCTNLANITIPDSVINIENNAFQSDPQLNKIVLGKNAKIFIKEFDDTIWYQKNLKVINGVEYIDDIAVGLADSSGLPQSRITIKEGTTAIASLAFANNTVINVVELPASMIAIGNRAFYNCNSLVNIFYVGTASEWASINGLDNVMNNNRILYINNSVPDEILIDNVSEIKPYAFYNCSTVKSVIIEDSITKIGDSAFSGCDEIETVYYFGALAKYTGINYANGNNALINAAWYFYVEEQPTQNGFWWHYENGTPTKWAMVENVSSYIRINANGIEDEEGNYILFGEYPQTIKSPTVSITPAKNNRGYYLGNDGEYYVYVVANPYKNDYTFSDDTRITEGRIYWFKVEPIKWRILSESIDHTTAKILCEMIIDVHRYDDNSNNYATSEIRAWLNDNFYNMAFNSLQKELINIITVDNSSTSTNTYYNNPSSWSSPGTNKNACENTNDKVWLLSEMEATNPNYGFNGQPNSYDSMRRKKVTDYAKANHAFIDDTTEYKDCGYWWLRSPYWNNSFDVWLIDFHGRSDCKTAQYYTIYGVVPALQISL